MTQQSQRRYTSNHSISEFLKYFRCKFQMISGKLHPENTSDDKSTSGVLTVGRGGGLEDGVCIEGAVDAEVQVRHAAVTSRR